VELTGRVALITGGGRGVGRACALGLARAGADVAVLARTASELEAVAADVRGVGRRALAVSCDVAQSGEVEAAVARVRSELGPVHILIASAGIAQSARFIEITDEIWDRHLRVNATGAFYAARAVIPDMLRAGWGRVVVVASVASKTSGRYMGAYSVSKHAALGLARSIAIEYADKGITANAVCPGYLETEMTARSIAAIVARTGRTAEETRTVLEATSPQRRLFTAEEVASLAVFLCTDAARGINGQGIVLDGGYLLS
jgi:NAD(P)-dependent dehydrogenase (short-subunit alcohol dehydrogenase family)